MHSSRRLWPLIGPLAGLVAGLNLAYLVPNPNYGASWGNVAMAGVLCLLAVAAGLSDA
jgi:hypothetical protein